MVHASLVDQDLQYGESLPASESLFSSYLQASMLAIDLLQLCGPLLTEHEQISLAVVVDPTCPANFLLGTRRYLSQCLVVAVVRHESVSVLLQPANDEGS